MTLREQPVAFTRRAEEALVDALGLQTLSLDPATTSATGSWRGQPVTLVTRAYRGGPLRHARFVEITGSEMAIGNALCVPLPEHPLPVFGADLVTLDGAALMLVTDLSPTLPAGEERNAQLAPLREVHAVHGSRLPPGGPLPPWCADWFSNFAMYTRISKNTLPAARTAFDAYLRVYESLCFTSVQRPEHAPVVARTLEGYAVAHRRDDRGLRMLAKLFGAPWAARYIAETLFPALLTLGAWLGAPSWSWPEVGSPAVQQLGSP
ncbi:hypothetical protein [Chondromyces crocatus]|uniref:Uncharacterized protein n=1 Tax=Chondromyces crocatus TaxID=52 RepID=A0A0K1E7P2_CHOCO|nr:hypothetical protein [Chondromyces crocatus]AKT36906.1 uncharacterized protein CMC5_010270 [Chondromyces crocatus]